MISQYGPANTLGILHNVILDSWLRYEMSPSAILPAQALPCGLPRQRLAKLLGRRQPRRRLADFRRFRSGVDRSWRSCTPTSPWAWNWNRPPMRGQHDDRPLPEPFSVGAVSAAQRGSETAHARGPAGQYPLLRADYPRKNPRCHRPRSSAAGTGLVLRDGSRVRRLSTPLSVYDELGILRDASQGGLFLTG